MPARRRNPALANQRAASRLKVATRWPCRCRPNTTHPAAAMINRTPYADAPLRSFAAALLHSSLIKGRTFAHEHRAEPVANIPTAATNRPMNSRRRLCTRHTSLVQNHSRTDFDLTDPYHPAQQRRAPSVGRVGGAARHTERVLGALIARPSAPTKSKRPLMQINGHTGGSRINAHRPQYQGDSASAHPAVAQEFL